MSYYRNRRPETQRGAEINTRTITRYQPLAPLMLLWALVLLVVFFVEVVVYDFTNDSQAEGYAFDAQETCSFTGWGEQNGVLTLTVRCSGRGEVSITDPGLIAGYLNHPRPVSCSSQEASGSTMCALAKKER